jgi:hypothetical protein
LLSELRGSGQTETPTRNVPRTPATSSAPAPSPARKQEPEPPHRLAPASAEKASAAGAAAKVVASPAEIPAAHPADERLNSIKALLFEQKKLLSTCLDHLSGWRFEDGEVRFLFAKNASFFADLLRSREQLDTLRSVCGQVLGQPVKICVTLDEQGEAPVAARPSARERAERDPAVAAFRKRFDCTLVDVKDLSQE